jgi:predicted nucleic acid-binding protein
MRRGLFVDSSAWYALADRDDVCHSRAVSFLRESLLTDTRLFTSNHVIGESYTLIRIRLGHAAAQRFLKSLDQTQRLERVFVIESQEETAWTWLRRYADQDFSFVDATSFVVMKALRLNEAFTFDKHFAAAGFVVLP